MALLSAGAAGGTTKNVMGKDPLKRPSDAVQLVGNQGHVMVPEGKGDSKWVFKNGVLTASPVWDSVITPGVYSDFLMHVEFNVNDVPDAKDPEKNGNSGVYIHQRH